MNPTIEAHEMSDLLEGVSWLETLEQLEKAQPMETLERPGKTQAVETHLERAVAYADLLDVRDDIAALGEQMPTSNGLDRAVSLLREENRRKDLELYATIRAGMHELRAEVQADLKQLRLDICKDFRAEIASHLGAVEQRLVERFAALW